MERWFLPDTLRLDASISITSQLDDLIQAEADLTGILLGEVVVGEHLVDPFVVAGSLVGCRDDLIIGVSVKLGAGRAASVIAREATCLDLLFDQGTALLLRSVDLEHLDEGLSVVSALFTGGPATFLGVKEQIHEAPNRPGPRNPGGPPLLGWLEDGDRPRVFRTTHGDRSSLETLWDLPVDLTPRGGVILQGHSGSATIGSENGDDQ